MSDDSNYVQTIFLAYSRLLTENYCIFASSAVLWFDYVLTFPDEYRRIWRRKFTGATLIFFMMRYSALVERVFFILEVVVWKSSNQGCGVITHGDDALTSISYLAIAAFTVLRVYSIWGRDWKLLLAVPVCFYSTFALIYESTQYIPAQVGRPIGCVEISSLSSVVRSRLSTSASAASIFSAGVVTLLTWIRTFAIVRHTWKAGTPMPVATLLLRDGTIYFLLILAFQIIQLSASFGDGGLSVWPYFNQVLLVIVHSRFMLGLRGLYFEDRGAAENEPTAHRSNIKFHRISASLVGNLGATLDLDDKQRASLTTPQDAMDGHIDSGSDWEDEAPEYCNDPFTTGMKDTESCEGAAEATQDSETMTV